MPLLVLLVGPWTGTAAGHSLAAAAVKPTQKVAALLSAHEAFSQPTTDAVPIELVQAAYAKYPKAVFDDLLRRFALAPFDGLTFRQTNHWDDDEQTQLTPAVRRRLELEFADSNARLAELMGWSGTWSALNA